MHLNIVGFVAAVVALAGIARHVREPGNSSLQWDLLLRHAKFEGDPAESLPALTAIGGRIIKAGHAHAILEQSFQVDVRSDLLLVFCEPLGFRQKLTISKNQRTPTPGKISRRSPRSRRRI